MKKIITWIFVIIIFSALAFYIFNNFQQKKPAIPSNAGKQTILSLTPKQLKQYSQVYKNPYVIHLRKALNGYLDGSNYGMDFPSAVIQASPSADVDAIYGLSAFDKSYYRSKFIVFSIDNDIGGGKMITIIFQNKPDKMFTAWVYKYVGAGYDLRGFWQDTKATPEKMKEIQIQYKNYLDNKTLSI